MSSSKSSRRRLEGTVKVKPKESATNGTDNSDDDDDTVNLTDTEAEDSGKDFKSKKPKGPSQSLNKSVLQLSDDLKKLIDRVTCCSCGKQLNVMNPGAVRKHPWLKVVTCKKCYKFLRSGPFTRDADGTDEQCRWCGDGGRLYGCDYCHNCFCRSCIKRNLGRTEATKMEDDDGSKWHCYMCKPKKIKNLTDDCSKILEYIAKEEKNEKEAEERRAQREKDKAENAEKERKERTTEKKDTDKKKGFPAPKDKSQVLIKQEIKEESLNVKAGTSSGSRASTPDVIVLDDSPLKVSHHHRAKAYRPDEATGVKQVQKAHNGVLEVTVGPKNSLPIVNPQGGRPQSKMPLLGGILTSNTSVGGSRIVKKAPLPNNIEQLKNNIQPVDIDSKLDRISTMAQSFNLSLSSAKTDMAIAKLTPNVNMYHVRQRTCSQVKSSLEYFLNGLRNIWGVQIVASNDPPQSVGAGDAVTNETKPEKLQATQNIERNNTSTPVKPNSMSALASKLVESPIPIDLESPVKKISEKSKMETDDQESDKPEIIGDSESVEKKDEDNQLETVSDDVTTEETKNKVNGDDNLPEVIDGEDNMESDNDQVEENDENMESKTGSDTSVSQTSSKKGKTASKDDEKVEKRTRSAKKTENESNKEEDFDEGSEVEENNMDVSENTAAELELLKEMADELNDKEEEDQSTEDEEEVKPRRSARASKTVESTTKEESDKDSPVRRTSRRRGKSDTKSDKNGDKSKTDKQSSKLKTSDKEKDASDTENMSTEEETEGKKSKDKVKVDKNEDNIKKSKGKKTKEKEESEDENVSEDEIVKSPSEKSTKDESVKSPSKKSTETVKSPSKKSKKEVSDSDDDEENNESSTEKSKKTNAKKDSKSPRKSVKKPSTNEEEIEKEEKSSKSSDKTKIEKKEDKPDKSDNSDDNLDNDTKSSKKGKDKDTKSKSKGKVSKSKLSVKELDSDNDSTEIEEEKIEVPKKSPKKGKKESPSKKKVQEDSMGVDSDIPTEESDTSDSDDESFEEFGKRRTRRAKAEKEESKKKEKSESKEKSTRSSARRTTRQTGKKSSEDELSDSDPEFDKDLEKEIKSLSKETRLSKKKQTSEKDNKKGSKQTKEDKKEKDKKATKQTIASDDSDLSSSVEMAVSEDENESEDETDNLSPSQLKKLKQAGKEILEGSDDEDDVIAEEISDSSDPEVSFPKLPGKSKKHGLSEDSDDSDFVSTKKSKRFRNKLLDTKITDSESETGKKGKKGKKGKGKGKRKHDSDAFSELSGEEEERQKGKKRRRIKKVASSDEENNKEPGEDDDVGSGEDDGEGTPGKNLKRKHIRKVISTTKQKDETKAAQRAEEERRKRIEERQKEYNTYVEIEGGEDEGEELPEGTEREHQTPVKAADSIAKILGSPRKVPVTTKCVLEMDKEKKKPLVEIDRTLVRKLKPHQVEAVRFMYNCCVESLEQMNKGKGSGCIVAHCMGLGKSLSVVSFVHTMLSHQKLTKMSKCLVVCPLNTVLNWVNEFEIWLDDVDFEIEVYEMSKVKQNFERAQMLKEWHEGDAGVMIIGYDMYRNLVSGSHCKNKKQKKIFYETLADPGPDITVCDEGHILKNDATSLSKAMMKVKSPRRIVLTGTPLQNNLGEYHCMVNFVKPNLLGTRKEFNNRFNNPITNGQCKDSTAFDVKLMKRRAHILHELLAGCVQRKDYSALTKFLPPKFEYVISVRLSPVQMKLYEKYLEMMLGPGADVNNKGARLFRDYQALMRIWTHPWILKLDEIRQENKRPFDDEDEDSFVDDSSGSDSFVDNSSSSSSNESDSESSAAGKKKARKRRTRGGGSKSSSDDEVKTVNQDEVVKKWTSKRRGNEEGAGSSWMEDMGYGNPDKNGAVTSEWWSEFVKEHDESNLELGGKLVLLFEILKMCEDIGDKVLVFSQSLLSLDIIEDFLQKVDEAQQELNTEDKPSTSGENNKSDKPDSSSKTDDTSTSGEAKEPEEKTEAQKNKENLAKYGRSWTKGADYFRMDGSTNSQNRKTSQDMFNDPENYRARLFLISTKAGSLGINLVSANRVIIFDASWNPSHDIQSIFRVYRFGQIKPVYVYRFLAQGTMEEKIYERQVTKQSLSQRVVDEHQIARHFTANDLQELYKFNPDRLDDPDKKDRPLPNLPKDHMLAELMTSNKEWVTTFHEHDSLLENVVEQELTEEEKKAAWEDYENEKKGLNRVQQMMGGQGLNPAVYATQQMSMQNLLLQGQANLGQAAVLQIVQDLKARFPSLPPEVFQQRVQAVLRQVLTQQLMQNSAIQRQQAQQLEQQRINELNRLNQMKQRIQQQQAMINNPNARYTMGQPSLLQAAMSGGSGLRPQTINQLRSTTPIDLTGQSPQPAKK